MIGFKNHHGIVIVKAAVIIFNQLADDRMVNLPQRVDNIRLFRFGRFEYKPLIYLTYIPMSRNGILTAGDIIKITISYVAFVYKILTDSFDIISMVNVRQLINPVKNILAKLINNIRRFIFCLSGDKSD